jgi:tetratricopeptide (TPR) repeat protein/nitrate/TMAO reductase-like tetraheme cytochrome c subunit
MQPYTEKLAAGKLSPQDEAVEIGNYVYRAGAGKGEGWMSETGPEGEKKYSMAHALGGKNVYYFLTPLEKGKLQTLPLAYDVNKKEWFDTAMSGVRHFAEPEDDEPVHWKDRRYTFNTACYRCHVSQLDTNYDLETDAYDTTWAEPGINCETCHGPGDEHVEACVNAPKDRPPVDLKIIRRGGEHFTSEQNNDSCSLCHAKMLPLTGSFKPGDRFFDHADPTTFEDPDYYPDGRDLGENYTFTSWRMSPCARGGGLSCLHCHTPSGRFLQHDDPDRACAPCHKEKAAEKWKHSRHPEDAGGVTCVSCHMPKTGFARMKRSDHSMLPPTPATTVRYGSPNACNACHTEAERDAGWADKVVREWHGDEYQDTILRRADMVHLARERDWSLLSDTLAYVADKNNDEIFRTSLVRLLAGCEDEKVSPALVSALSDPSPLLRAAAAATLGARLTGTRLAPDVVPALVKLTGDDYRLVRIRAAEALASVPPGALAGEDEARLDAATREYLASLTVNPDRWFSHYNLANFHLDRGEHEKAVTAYETALKLEPTAIMAMANLATAHAQLGDPDEANSRLAKALQIAPDDAAVNFNMGLLQAELGDTRAAEQHLRKALESDPALHAAAFNLGVMLADTRPGESMDFLKKAFELLPGPDYAYTVAYYMRKNGELEKAASFLEESIGKWPGSTDQHLLLAEIYQAQGKTGKAEKILSALMKNPGVPPEEKARKAQGHREYELKRLAQP